ncbi:MAG: Glu-tRNA(Gln) amidotransferase subunit GatE [Thaumarchaeota archaeon]|nr:Glu-tRNA(Gln) amidotransferase subunit GatE [Nitrososphaerota archaeon]
MGREELLVGLEIHQQLACSTKLFCACPPVKTEEFPYHFERRLRPAQSETGKVDPAATFEYSKGKSNIYFWSPESSCLVDADEEPPHCLSGEGLEAALLTAATLGSNPMDEVHVMRKIVIDGSNTGGFQRTAVVGLGGSFDVEGTSVGVQSVTIEEDAARILGEDETTRRFALDRLGVGLVEVALDPVRGDPEFVARVALHLGRVLRSTGRVARGLGTIRQDLNVSLDGGMVVEVKGVQKLNLLPKVVDYERRRQTMLAQVSRKLKEKGIRRVKCTFKDATTILSHTGSGALKRLLSGDADVVCICAEGLGGLFGWEPEPGVRLGKELAEVARANSLGGVIHSDEFESQGVGASEEEALRRTMGCSEDDGLVLVAGRKEVVDRVVPLLVSRLEQTVKGVPAETRAATDAGETRYMRPRPGSQRMYPETDIPVIQLTRALRAKISKEVPEDWSARVERLQRSYSLSRDLALKVYDSEVTEDFEELSKRLRLEPSFIASVLVDIPARMGREGVPEAGYAPDVLTRVLDAVSSGRAAKEAIPDILKLVGEKGVTVAEAIDMLGLVTMSEAQVALVIRALVARESQQVSEKGESAFSPLMGEAMKELRGKADGATVARLLRQKINETLRK